MRLEVGRQVGAQTCADLHIAVRSKRLGGAGLLEDAKRVYRVNKNDTGGYSRACSFLTITRGSE